MKDTLGRENRKLKDRNCKECRALFRPWRSSSKYCSRACAWKNNGGHNKKKESWWVNSKGYIEGRVWINEHTQVRVKKHRWVMENHLGRKLEECEDVHHLDGDKGNNSLENLQLISHSDHATKSNHEREYKSGYKMVLDDVERQRRSDYAKSQELHKMGQSELARRRKENN